MSRGQASEDSAPRSALHPQAHTAGPQGPLPTSLSLLPTLPEPEASNFPLPPTQIASQIRALCRGGGAGWCPASGLEGGFM